MQASGWTAAAELPHAGRQPVSPTTG